MFIGHLPAGYILTDALQKKFNLKKYLWIGLIGSIFPDIDILYFYLIDNRQNLHHSYWTHLPFDWLIISAIAMLAIWLLKRKAYLVAALIFFSNVFLHLLLDTIVGKIEWLYPLTTASYALFEVPATHNFWVYNFLLHWTFLFEIGAILWAVWVFVRNRNSFN